MRNAGIDPTPGALFRHGERPWDLSRVVHLHRRAGFGATWFELQQRPCGRPRRGDRPHSDRTVPSERRSHRL